MKIATPPVELISEPSNETASISSTSNRASLPPERWNRKSPVRFRDSRVPQSFAHHEERTDQDHTRIAESRERLGNRQDASQRQRDSASTSMRGLFAINSATHTPSKLRTTSN